MTPAMLASFERLLALLDEPESIPVLAPLIQREIHYRLLQSDQASRLRQITSVDGQGYRIAKAIDWLKLNYTSARRVDELSARVRMSVPTSHLFSQVAECHVTCRPITCCNMQRLSH